MVSKGGEVATSALIAMILTGGFVWGGFLVLLAYGIRQERKKTGTGGSG
jgi:hypothetical protein